jgi:hypothetical protein
MDENLSKSIAKYIRELDIIILGIGVLRFVSDSDFSHVLFADDVKFSIDIVFNIAFDVIFFATIYIFLTYDWIAHSALMLNFPYKADGKFGNLTRMYIDLFQLFMKALLVYICTVKITAWHLLLTASFFTIWHSVILLWHWRVSREYSNVNTVPNDHFIFLSIYVLIVIVLQFATTSIIAYAAKFTSDAADVVNYAFLIILCALINVTSFTRQHRFLGKPRVGTPISPTSVLEFEEHVKRLRAVVEAYAAAEAGLQGLETLLKTTQENVQNRLVQ